MQEPRLESTRRRVASDKAYEAVQELIVDERLPGGARLNIDQLSVRLGLSSTPIREALARLESEGVVYKETMRGYFVAELLNAAGAVQMYEVRLLLETHAATLAAQHRTDVQLNLLTDIIRDSREASTGSRYREFRAFARADAAFHRAVASASGNLVLADTLCRLNPHQHLSRLWTANGVPDPAEAIVDHQAILESIISRDHEQARHRMEAHLRRSRDSLLRALDPAPTVRNFG